MPAHVTYTAKRHLEKAGLSVVAADISVLASDDSFNTAGVVDFSGMNSGEWVLVSGFSDPSSTNNGWHQLEANSTTTKLDTTSALTDESAGASVSIVGYKRGYGELYSIDLPLKMITRRYKIIGDTNTPISGASETLVKRDEVTWDVSFTPIHRDNFGPLREFISSVMARETFTLDPHGTIASPVDPVSVEMIVESYTEIPHAGDPAYLSAKFSVREL